VSAVQPATLAWLERLVAHETVPGASNLPLIKDVEKELYRLGIPFRVVAGSRAGTSNLLAKVGPPDLPALLLSAHTDVVHAETDQWSSHPFRLARRNRCFYGRGTTDMKGFIAAILGQLPMIASMKLTRPLAIALSCDEEGRVEGVRPLLASIRAAGDLPYACIVGEPTSMNVAVAHKGKAALRVIIRGRAAHASAPARGQSAILGAARLVAKLEEFQRQLAQEPGDPRFPLPTPSINVGRISGGVAVNVVPERCELDLEIRASPAQDLTCLVDGVRVLGESLAHEMRNETPEAGVETIVESQYPGLDERSGVAELIAALAGGESGLAVDFGTEAGLYSQTLEVPTVICGPGDIAQAHVVDEYINEGELARAERFIARVAEWCVAPDS